MSVFARAISICREEGVRVLVMKSKSLLWRRIVKPVEDFYWNIKGVQSITINGISATFEASLDSGGDVIRWMHRIEKEFLLDLIDELKTNDTFYDVGANIGVFSCFALQRVSDGRVIAFEPYPPNVEQLHRNLQLNEGEDRAEVIEVALMDSRKPVLLAVPNSEEVGSGTIGIATETEGESIRVSGRTGDELVANGVVPPPDVVKIDVEGSESMVIDGLWDTLASESCRLLYCEIHTPAEGRSSVEDYGRSPDEVLEQIRKLGFKVKWRKERGTEIHVKAKK